LEFVGAPSGLPPQPLPGAGTYPVPVPSLADGAHDLTAVFTPAVIAPLRHTVQVTIDTEGPEVATKTDGSGEYDITFATVFPGLRVVFADEVGMDEPSIVDKANYAVWASGGDGTFGEPNDIDLTGDIDHIYSWNPEHNVASLWFSHDLADEVYRLIIRGTGSVRDLAGNRLLDGADFEILLERNEQAATVALDLQAASDHGTADDDDLTNDPTPTFDVTVNEAGVIHVYSADHTFDQTRVVSAAGTEAFTPAADLDDGLHTITADFTPTSGAGATDSLDVTIDTRPPEVAMGAGGSALIFDGSDDYVSTPVDIDQGSGSPGATFEAWVRPTSTSGGRHYVISTDNGGYDWSLLREGGTWYVFTGSGSRSTGFSVDVDTWQHVAAVFIPGTGVEFYKNGERAEIPQIGYDGSDRDVAIGRRPGSGGYFAGTIDEARVWQTVRTQEQISGSMHEPLTGAEPGLLGYWNLDEGAGDAAADGSPNGNDGTLGTGSARPVWTDDGGPVIIPRDQSQPPVERRVFLFDEPIDTGTFDPAADVAFSGPGTATVDGSDRFYRVSFDPIWTAGTYTVTVGPHVADPAGNELDFDGNGVGGEPGDEYVDSFEVLPDTTPPVVTNVILQPSGLAVDPAAGAAGIGVTGVTLDLSEPIQGPLVLPAGFELLNLGADGQPGGGDDTAVTPLAVTPSAESVDVDFGGALPYGKYQLTVDDTVVVDLAGNPLDAPFVFDVTSYHGVHADSVFWTSDSDGSWDDPSNWSTGVVPGAGDRVVIDRIGADPVVSVNSNTSALTLDSEEPMVIADGELTLHGPSEIAGDFTINNNRTVTVTGAGASLLVTGPTHIDGANLYAKAGGVIEMPQVTSYTNLGGGHWAHRWLRATGAGSRLSLPNLETLTGNGGWWCEMYVEALDGGEVDLGSTTHISQEVELQTTGAGSLLDLSSLEDFTGRFNNSSSGFTVKDQGTLRSPNLATVATAHMRFDGTGVMDTGQITSYTGGGTVKLSGTDRDFGALETLNHIRVEINGVPQQFPLLTNADGSSFLVSGGVTVTIPLVTTYTNTLGGNWAHAYFRATGAGTVLSFPNLTSFTGSTHWWSESYLEALDGGRLDLSAATQIEKEIEFKATGAGSLLDLSSLTTFHGLFNNSSSGFTATDQGTILCPNMDTVITANMTFDGTGVMDTGQITSYTGGGTLKLSGIDRDFGALETLNHIRVEVNGVPQQFPLLTNIDGCSFLVSGGVTVTIPLPTSYTNTLGGNWAHAWFRASGAGTVLSLPALTTFVGSTHWWSETYIEALEGGEVDFSAVTHASNELEFLADGADSRLDLSALQDFTGMFNNSSSGVTTSDQGRIDFGTAVAGTSVATANMSVGDGPGLHTTELQLGANTKLVGSGAVHGDVVNGSSVQPGGEPGGLTIDGDYSQTAAGSLAIQVGGTAPVTGHDVLTITGHADLAGTLALSLIDPFVPALGGDERVDEREGQRPGEVRVPGDGQDVVAGDRRRAADLDGERPGGGLAV
ncbi:MAG: LamG-like jellyroll fold domain-containing protein, partial [Planctomycetota bacterium]